MAECGDEIQRWAFWRGGKRFVRRGREKPRGPGVRSAPRENPGAPRADGGGVWPRMERLF